MKKIYTCTLFICFTFSALIAQMRNGKFGNEWINFNQSYYKISVAEDGIYRITYQELLDSGIPVNTLSGSQFQLFHMGDQVPVFTSTNISMGNGDFIEFYGQRNRGELDRLLWKDPDTEMLNRDYSIITDTSAYFLTWSDPGSGLYFEEVNNDLTNPPAKEIAFIHEIFPPNELGTFVKNRINTDGAAYSTFEMSDGFSYQGEEVSQVYNITPTHVATSGTISKLKVRFTVNHTQHQQSIKVNGSEIFNESYSNRYLVKDLDFELNTSDIASGADILFEGLAGINDRQAVGYLSLSYPREFNFDGLPAFAFTIEASNSKRYLEIENFNTGGSTPILYNITKEQRMVATLESGVVKIVLPPSTENQDLVLIGSNSGFKNAGILSPANFIDYTQESAQYVIISNKRLYDDGQGNNWVQTYANYRSSTSGGGFETIIVEIQQLYDQFAYGINRHPFAVKNFAQKIHADWSDLQYLFLIGKGREYSNTRTSEQMEMADTTFFIPTFSFPGSDNLLMSATDKDYPLVASGRIAATTPNDIRIYLEKVLVLEENQNGGLQTVESQLWKKRILHLGGGGPGERAIIKRHLESMEEVIENNKFGARVTSVYKTSSDPVQISESEEIFNTINSGVSMITFFGHSGVGTFDFNIDNPVNYNNYGKYPLMFSLGCYSGNIHTSDKGISERFVYFEDKGAIAFGATTGLGYVSVLHQSMEHFYGLAGGELYGAGMGELFRRTLIDFDNTSSFAMRSLIQQFTLQGDPAIRINPSQGPDYMVPVNSVSFNPMRLTATMDSFEIKFSITNLGFGISDSINIQLKQELPNGDLLTIVTDRIATPKYETPLSYSVASFKKSAGGQNRLFIEVDIDNEIEEAPDPQAEFNNEMVNASGSPGILFYIFDDSAYPVYPEAFAIVNEPDITLKASTTNALSKERKYIIELDTTELFNSSMKTRKEIVQGGGVIKWSPNISMQDGTVYYWRVSPDSISTIEPFVWETSSFIYLPASSKGWNQSHYYQYQKDDFEGMKLNGNRDLTFGVNGFFIGIKNKLYNPDNPPAYIYDLGQAAASVRPWGMISSGVAVVVGDGVNGGAWSNEPGGLYGSHNIGWTLVFSFPTNTLEERETLINFLEQVIPANDYVFLFTVQRPGFGFHPEEWAQDSVTLGKNLFSVLEAQGAQKVRELEAKGTVPYTFIYHKDNNVLAEDIASNLMEEIFTEVFVPINRIDGSMISTTIGPVKKWEKLNWENSGIDDPIADTSFVTIFGIDHNKNEVLLIDRLYSKDTMLNFIQAETYPYLKLVYNAIDDVNRTPAQLDYWRVSYEGLPDAAINSNEFFSFKQDTLQQGDLMQIEVAVENISDYDMDSLLVKLLITDESNNELVKSERYDPLLKDEIFNAKFDVDTRNISGIQQLVLEVNPDNDQPELYHFNNFAINQFFVDKDKHNPLLDVTFDGVHIMNGDIVSPTPHISINLKDENQFLLLADTSLFNVFLKYPGQEIAQIVPFNSEWINFIPASGGEDNNEAAIELDPVFEEDGIYELLVQAEDATGNQSGDLDYKVSFEVITKSSISNVLNYPNPFSTSTQFVYTLTGSDVPEYFKIQIFTVSGKIVREITQDEIGPLKIGTHRTDFRWDGTDEYGDRLANGVYLYRVIAKKPGGDTYDEYDNRTNNLFKKGFGKMVIFR